MISISATLVATKMPLAVALNVRPSGPRLMPPPGNSGSATSPGARSARGFGWQPHPAPFVPANQDDSGTWRRPKGDEGFDPVRSNLRAGLRIHEGDRPA